MNGLNTPLDSVMQLQNTGSVSSAIFVHMDLLPFFVIRTRSILYFVSGHDLGSKHCHVWF